MMFQSGSSSDFPTITLSACEDSDDEDDEGFVQRDSVIQVGQVRGGEESLINKNKTCHHQNRNCLLKLLLKVHLI